MRPAQRAFEETLRRETGHITGGFFMDWARHADGFAQFSVAGFEYPRNDLPANVQFVGPMSGPPVATALPDWWSDLDDPRPVIHVSQGTVGNADLGELVIPTIRALADSDVLVVATTGGPDVASLGPLPANARAAEFIPHDAVLPRTSAFVTNGGCGGLNRALRHGVPIVVAGMTEDKLETSRRVGWSGVGIDLRTSNPADGALRDAVHEVLAEPRYRRRAEDLARQVADSSGIDGLDRMISAVARG
ncbi:glycosyltransferase [Gordonia phthalatica]|uniref:glycosyltransferase n=1 Tax=Gordonia phthalatica TaxID=1136941 RepID=UPI0012FED257|nr:nucleotide disphospho-sugar-binding domain-containing protein [Gordonia phthalatica]